MAYQQRPSFRCSRVGNQSVCSRKYAKRELQGGRRLGHHTKLSRLEDLQVVGVRASILFLSNCNLEILVFVENGKPENPENPPPPPPSRSKNQQQKQQTQFTYGTRVTMMEGELSNQCPIFAVSPSPSPPSYDSPHFFCSVYSILFYSSANNLNQRFLTSPVVTFAYRLHIAFTFSMLVSV